MTVLRQSQGEAMSTESVVRSGKLSEVGGVRAGERIAMTPPDPERNDVSDPETRSFRQIFASSMLRFAEEARIRRHYRIERDRWVLEAQA
jgi:hypothetical protein